MRSQAALFGRRTAQAAQFALLAICLASSARLGAEDWPRWRGPRFDGISTERGWQTQWPAQGPKVLWRANVGIGYPSVSVSRGKLYTVGNTADVDTVYCLDAASGKTVWTHSYPCIAKDPNGHPGPRSTPTVDGPRVYTLSRLGHLFCLDAATGKVIWSKDFRKDYGAKPPTWGYAGSPLAEGRMLITEVGGKGSAVVAFDKLTGREIWRAGDDPPAYSSIVPFDFQGKRLLAVLSAAGLAVREAADGREIARYPWKTPYNVNAATPIIFGNNLFISSGYGKGCALLRLGPGGLRPIWQSKVLRNHVATCILWKGYLYGFDESRFKCVEAATGKEIWSDRRYGKGSVTMAGGSLIVFGNRGRAAVVAPSPQGLREISAADVLRGKNSWTPPVLANGRLYCRVQEKLACLDVSAGR
ncbi:MAG: PQQ-like beta-propeller repeat protein [Verrucomicrobia bacterium]|nr:PQQ-like beta-propeller repeat protein [Verrucomicrobiota bacterium]